MVVDSPPGTMAPAKPFNSSTVLTSTGSTPSRRKISACSWTSPWSARMPTLGLSSPLPATRREPLLFLEIPHLPPDHRLAEAPPGPGHGLRVLEVRRRLNDGPRPEGRVAALEDAAPDKDAVGPELHHERRVRRRGDAARGEKHDRQPPVLRYPPDQLVRRPELLGLAHQLVDLKHAQAPDAPDDCTHVADRLDDVAGAGLALGPAHRRTLADAPGR